MGLITFISLQLSDSTDEDSLWGDVGWLNILEVCMGFVVGGFAFLTALAYWDNFSFMAAQGPWIHVIYIRLQYIQAFLSKICKVENILTLWR